MTAKKRPEGWNEQDLRISVGMVLLGTNEKAAEFAGCAERTVYNRLKENGDFIATVNRTLEEAMRLRRRDVVDIGVNDQVKELSKRYATAMAVLDEALAKGDYEVAKLFVKEGIDRNHGKARQTMKIEGENHTYHHLPPGITSAFESMARTINASQSLYLPLPVEEADVVLTPDSNE